jgi:hypothetical protein
MTGYWENASISMMKDTLPPFMNEELWLEEDRDSPSIPQVITELQLSSQLILVPSMPKFLGLA